MDNGDLKKLISTFKEYRDLLTPIQRNLQTFAETYDYLREDIEKINVAFEGDIRGNLKEIYDTLSTQANKATDLSSRIDDFVKVSNQYTSSIHKFLSIFEEITKKIETVEKIEAKAEEQISKLDSIIEEKKKSYNIRDLQKSLANYNENVQQVSEFINEKVAESIKENNHILNQIKDDNNNIISKLQQEKSSIDDLLHQYKTTNQLLKNIVEKQDVNEEYIFDILDNWAISRKVKIKK